MLRRAGLPLLVALACVLTPPPADADTRAEALQKYKDALIALRRAERSYEHKDMDRDLRRAYEVFIQPWLDRNKPDAPKVIEYDFAGYDGVFEKWAELSRKKGEAAKAFAAVGGVDAAKILFKILLLNLDEVVRQDQVIRKLSPKAYSVYEQVPAVLRYGAWLHVDALVEALGTFRGRATHTWMAGDAWTGAEKWDQRRRTDLARIALVDAMGRTESESLRGTLTDLSDHADRRIRIAGLEALARLKEKRDALRDRMLENVDGDPCFSVRVAALDILRERIPDPRVVPGLARTLGREIETTNGIFRGLLREALKEIVGKDLGEAPGPWLAWFEKNKKAIEDGTWKKGEDAGSDVPPGRESVVFYDIRTVSKRILCLIDASDTLIMPVDIDVAKEHNYFHWRSLGSKDRDYVSQYDLLVLETMGMVEQLKPDAMFNLVVMHESSQLTPFWKRGMAKASPRVKKAVKPFLDDIHINGWAPQIMSLWAAYEMAGYEPWGLGVPDQPAADTIFLLSDGVPSGGQIINGPALVDDVRRHHRWARIPIHTIRVYDFKDTAEEVMKGIAEVTGGTYVWRTKP